MSEINIYYLVMHSIEQLNAKSQDNGLTIVKAKNKVFTLNRELYTLVGEQWQWKDKLKWSDSKWQSYVSNEQLRTWLAYYNGDIAGYFELLNLADGEVEIAYFGLVPQFIGKGFGGYMLSQAVKLAWQECQAKSVTVNTCTLDHKNALSNYQARGFEVYRKTVDSLTLKGK